MINDQVSRYICIWYLLGGVVNLRLFVWVKNWFSNFYAKWSWIRFNTDFKSDTVTWPMFVDVSAYRNDPKFSDRQVWANSVDPDQMATLFVIPFASFGPITL